MKNCKYHGVVVPMVTPFTEYGKVDVAAVERIIKSFVESNVSPLLLGTTGEGNSVSPSESLRLVECAVKAAEGKILIYACLTGNCLSGQIKAAEAYTQAGADVIVSTLPNYYALTDEQIYHYYKTLADSIKGPLMLYNITSTVHMSIPVNVIKRLCEHPNIVGLKDSERNTERMDECLALLRDRDDFAYFCGCAAFSAYSLSHGADGIVPSSGNFVPKKYNELYLAAINGDTETTEKLQDETNKISQIYQAGHTLGESLTALKVMMGTLGLCDAYMLPPLTRLGEEEEKEIALKAKAVKR